MPRSQEGSDIQLLPCLQIGPDHDCDLGVELHEGSGNTVSFRVYVSTGNDGSPKLHPFASQAQARITHSLPPNS